MEKIDVVYVLGTGSNWNNNEIRFSLRSIEKNLKGFGKVYIIGECPEWMKNVIHIQHPDEFGPGNADGNIIRKILRAIKEPMLSQQFMFINDDHLVIKPLNAAELPFFHKGNLADPSLYSEKYFGKNYWRKRLGRTRDVLLFKGLPALHFDCHTPIIIDKEIFPKVIEKFDYGVAPGYTMKSIYANSAGVKPTLLEDQKKVVFDFLTRKQIDAKVADAYLMSFNDGGLNEDLKIWLAENFPVQSTYEKTDYVDVYYDITIALKTPNNKQLIRNTFIKYGRERNLVAMVMASYSDQMHEKILFKLKRMLT